ncbi:FkbM family methyltransferase [Geovibrio thiophilus]|uniref:FkbM family methyltransferase n=1 Tax=Geovibrio thiophilus TaxID=139438 RepID=A0A3R5Y5B7_9BACT|nr:FkbM family methyltransferase [Geovibrio thiophilus]QAR32089.1 FkbM family methyltransferase [Geovibrio thiophilus]
MNGFIETLFGSMPADFGWLEKLKQAADAEPVELFEAETAAENIYKTDDEYKNALSRLAYYLAYAEQYDEALRLFEKDAKSGRQTWWGKLRHAECIALSGDAATASAMVQETYSESPAAVNGFGHMGWALLRTGKAERAEVIEIVKRDIELGRITNGFKLVAGRIIAPVQADMAEKLINEAYSADSSLKDGFYLIAVEFMREKDYAVALRWFEKDDAGGRMSSEQRLKYAEILARTGRMPDAERNVEAAYESDALLKDGYSRLLRFSSVFDAPRFAHLLAEEKRRGRSTGIYAEADAERLSENYGLLADIERAEKRFGISVGLQYVALEKMVRENAGAGFADVLGFRLKIVSPFDVLVQFREIFLEENYYFTSEKEAPFIIDGGANAGMALAYFKWLYPSSAIAAFEPNPELYEICKENIETNGWESVTLHPYALSDSEGTAQFTVYPSMPMGSGLAGRFSALESRRIDVKTVRLSGYMSEYTDFLKLDIEGAEEAVLREAADSLSENCGSGFIEYHYDSETAENSLGSILHLLEDKGFAYEIRSMHIRRKNAAPADKWSMNIFFTSRRKSDD